METYHKLDLPTRFADHGERWVSVVRLAGSVWARLNSGMSWMALPNGRLLTAPAQVRIKRAGKVAVSFADNSRLVLGGPLEVTLTDDVNLRLNGEVVRERDRARLQRKLDDFWHQDTRINVDDRSVRGGGARG